MPQHSFNEIAVLWRTRVAQCVLMGDGEEWRLMVQQHGKVVLDVAMADESTALRMGRLWRKDYDIGS